MVGTRRRPAASQNEAGASVEEAAREGVPAADAPQQPSGSAAAAGPPSTGQLDAFRTRPQLSAAVQQLLPQVSDPTALLQPNPNVSQATRATAQMLYDYGIRAMLAGARDNTKAQVIASLLGLPAPGTQGSKQTAAGKLKPPKAIPQLCVDPAFDPEQIWMQLDLATGAVLKKVRRLIANTAPLTTPGGGSLIHPQHEAAINAIAAGDLSSSSDDEGEEDESDLDLDEGDEDLSDGQGLSSDDEEEEQQQGRGRAKKKQRRGAGSQGLGLGMGDDDEEEQEDEYGEGEEQGLLPFEDNFMRIRDMDRFLNYAEKRASRADAGMEAEEPDEDEEDIDLELAGGNSDEDEEEGPGVDDDDDDDDDEGGEDEDEEEAQLRRLLNRTAKLAGKRKEKGVALMYKQFFGPLPGKNKQQPKDDEQEDDDEGDDYEDEDGQEDGRPAGRGAGGLLDSEEASSDEEQEQQGTKAKRSGKAGQKQAQPLSTHQKRLLRLQEQIAELEQAAVAEKDWYQTGEVAASQRPLNSALEVDMDFDTTVRPPPEPTQEAMADLEEMIKKRIAEHRFDDVVRILPAPVQKERKEVELNDAKSSKGLGEVYEDEFVKAREGGSAPDAEDTQLHKDCKMLFQTLMSKLDALTHFHFAPKPVVEDLTVKTDVAAVAMEEAAPVAISAANMRLPGEVYKPEGHGAPKAEGELDREDRKRRRAKRKRGAKAAKQEKDAEARARAMAAGQALPVSDAGMPVAGRKSAAALTAARALGGKKGARKAASAAASAAGVGASQHARTQYGKSSAVFAEIQRHADEAKANGGKARSKVAAQADKPAIAGSFLKL